MPKSTSKTADCWLRHAPARLAIIDGMDHVLKRAAPDAASYTDPTRPLAPGLADSILRFLDDPR